MLHPRGSVLARSRDRNTHPSSDQPAELLLELKAEGAADEGGETLSTEPCPAPAAGYEVTEVKTLGSTEA